MAAAAKGSRRQGELGLGLSSGQRGNRAGLRPGVAERSRGVRMRERGEWVAS
jgi:hypothetical protein